MRIALNRRAPTELALLIVLASGCSSPVAPGAPGPAPLPTPRAVLAIEDPSVIFRASQTRGLPGFEAEVRFLLRETGRTIGATIGTVTVPGETRDGFCTAGLYVAPGGVLDTYYTDEGFKSLGYCATYLGIVPTRTLGVPASVSVTFADDDGVLGTVSAVAVEK